MITLHCGEKTYDIQVEDTSYRYRAIMEKPQLVLKFSRAEYIDIPVGAWCMFQNEKYTLKVPSNLKKSGTRNIEYNLTMGQDDDDLGVYKMRNSVDGRLKYSMTAKAHELVEEVVKNLNDRTGSNLWSVGTVIDSTEKTIEFNHAYIDEALQSIADLFETEWEIVGHTIHLKKVEYFKDDPLPLSYGKGNGFVPGVGRTVQSDEMPIKRIYVQGGSKNIDRSKYGSSELLLPKNQYLEYEGRTYKTDADGYYIERVDKVSDAVKDDSLDCSEIYPSRIGTVSSVEVIDASKNFYDILDSSIPSNLNYNDYIIAGETPTIIFQSGILAGDGKEFEFKYNHAERRFEIVPQEIDGITMPDSTFKPVAGDTYAVFGIMLPDSYICNNLDKTGASWDMFREGAKKLYENEDQKFTFTGELQGLWAKRNWLEVGGRLKVGGYILFSDEQFAPEGMSIRITGIKDYVNNPYSPSLEISNSVSGKSLSSQLKEIGNQEVAIDDTKKNIIQFTKRRFRDAIETIDMLKDSMLDFSESVNPIAVQTMALLIGDESLQFRFVNSKTDLTPFVYNITYDQQTKQLHCPHGFLQHMTLGINSISSSHKSTEYKVWEMSEYLSPVLVDADKKYYLYAKVSRTSTSVKGNYLLSEKAIAMDDVEGYYHLLVGVLNTEIDGARSYVDLYGFTEILPGRITTDRIVCSDGISFIDLLNNAMHIGNNSSYMDWNNLTTNMLSLKNVSIETVNSNGTVMYSFSGVDGSGRLAKGNIVWDKDGKIKATGGTFENVLINGAIRTPFRDGYYVLSDDGPISVSTLGLQNNNNVVIPIPGGGWQTAVVIPFSSEYNGFRAIIMNDNWGADTSGGTLSHTAPSGKYYFENGVKKNTLEIPRNSGVEIIGYGEGNNFKGWIVLNRIYKSDHDNGFPLHVMFYGMVRNDSLVKIKKYHDESITFSKLSTGKYRITFGQAFSDKNNYTVILTGFAEGTGRYASVSAQETTYFDVYTGDDDSPNDGGFQFMVLSSAPMYMS